MKPKEVKEEGCKERIQQVTKKRKQNLGGILWSKRIINPSSNQNLLVYMKKRKSIWSLWKDLCPWTITKRITITKGKEKVRDARTVKHMATWSLIYYYFFGYQGHTKKKCYKYEIHYLVQIFKKGQSVAESMEK